MRTPKKIAYDKRYYQEHKKEHLAKARAYYLAHREKIKKYSKEYYDKVADERRELWNERSKKKYLQHRGSRLAWHKKDHKDRRIKFLNLVGGGKCKACGFSDWRALQIDHINGGGNQERREHGGQMTRKKQAELVANNPSAYQVLCANCNFIKRYENQETAKIRIQA